MAHPLTPLMRRTIDACQRSHNLCEQALIAHTLGVEQRGKLLDPTLVRVLMDCAAVCATSSGFILRGSHFSDRLCHLCAIICKSCAEGCEQVGGMADCLHACRRCAELCEKNIEASVVTEQHL